MVRKSGLGRGLDALIPTGSTDARSGTIQIHVDQIRSNPRQPRRDFDQSELENLANSIREHGILQPLIVTPDEAGSGYFTLIAGERRWMAAKIAGLRQVPALLRDADDQQRLELALIENIQRTDLSPLDAAEAYRQLSDEFGLSHEQIANRVGKSRVVISNTLRLLKLATTAQDALRSSQISEGHARALLSLPSEAAQNAALHNILRDDLTVRQTEALVRKLVGERPKPQSSTEPKPHLRAIEERLRTHLGTKVNLRGNKNGGNLVISYYSDEELNYIIERILGNE